MDITALAPKLASAEKHIISFLCKLIKKIPFQSMLFIRVDECEGKKSGNGKLKALNTRFYSILMITFAAI
jgi:hypothetical protein